VEGSVRTLIARLSFSLSLLGRNLTLLRFRLCGWRAPVKLNDVTSVVESLDRRRRGVF